MSLKLKMEEGASKNEVAEAVYGCQDADSDILCGRDQLPPSPRRWNMDFTLSNTADHLCDVLTGSS